ncbi:MAG: cation transporter [Mangrovicoccus sp.]|nr:cation transporter [Mangrovicoccus sp.]
MTEPVPPRAGHARGPGCDHDHSQEHGHDHGHDRGAAPGHGGHAHAHAPEVSASNERLVLIAFFITAGFMVVEALGGLFAGSLALVADAGHMLTDAAALLLAWAGFRFGRRGSDARRTFGYARLEILASFVNALALIALVIWITIEAVGRLMHPGPVMAGPMFVIATLGLVVNLVMFRMLRAGDHSHVNMKGALLHVLGDLLGSVAAIAAAVVIWLTGWTPIDPILSVLLSVIILRGAFGLLSASLHVLMEGTPAGIDVDEVAQAVRDRVEGVEAVSHVHVWSITSGRPAATMEVQIAPGTDPGGAVRAVKAALAQGFGIGHATIEIDWDRLGAGCGLGPVGGDGHAPGHDRGHGPAGDRSPARRGPKGLARGPAPAA